MGEDAETIRRRIEEDLKDEMEDEMADDKEGADGTDIGM